MDGLSASSPTRASASDTPLVFVVKPASRIVMTGIGLCFLGLGIVLAFFVDGKESSLLTGALAAVPGLFFLAASELVMARQRVELTEGGIEYRTRFGVRRLDVSQIRGYRVGGDQKSPSLILEPHDRSLKKLKIPLSLKDGERIGAWAGSRFPDLDELEKQSDLERILANEEYGFTVEERQAFLARNARLTQWLFWIAMGLGAWTWLFPRPYEVVVGLQGLVVLAALAMGALGRGLVRMWGGKGSAHPAAGGVLFVPAVVLCVRAMLDFDLDSWAPAALPMAATGLVLLFLVLVCFREVKGSLSAVAGAACACAALGVGSVVIANGVFDHGEPRIVETIVVDKRITHGKTTTRTLILAPWEGRSETVDYSVDKELFQSVGIREPVWVWIRSGALGIPWYFVTPPQR